MKKLLLFIIFFLAIIIPPSVFAQPMMGYGWNNMMGGWGGFGLGWVFMTIFWILIILGVVALVRYLGGHHNADKDRTPLEILKERYAKGEIDKKEFEGKKKDLS